ALSYHNFERVMGLAVRPDAIAVAARAQVWSLHAAHDLAARVEPAGRHDACFLTRSSHFTGEIQAHELAWAGDELWLVNTAFGCLCTLDGLHSFVPRWRPPFLTALAAEDRCHLNGLAVAGGAPRDVTALARTDPPQGWRGGRGGSGGPLRAGPRPGRGARVRHAALAARPRRPGVDAALGGGATGAGRSGQRSGGDGDRAARLHARPGHVRPLRVYRPVEDPRDLDVRRHADRRAAAGAEVRRRRSGPNLRPAGGTP